MSNPLAVLQEFSAAIQQGQPAIATELFAPDGTYEEPPMPMLRGRAEILDFFTDFAERHTDVIFAISRAFADADNTHVAAEWRFSHTRTSDGLQRHYEGMSILEYTSEGLIASFRGFSALL